jgi:predicted RNA-binding protein with PIN domain
VAYHFLVDGYNLLYALKVMPPGPWPDKRRAVITLLKTERPQGNNAVTVVFDSREGLGDRFQDQSVAVVYTSGETADEWIGAKVRRSSNPRNLIVISNDLGIRTLVQGTGARFMRATEFLKKCREDAHPKLPAEETFPDSAITDEFKKKWL